MRLGVHARGGVRNRGTSTLPTLTGEVKTDGRIWTTSLGTAAAPAIAMGVLGNDGAYSAAAGNTRIVAGGDWNVSCGSPGATTSLQGALTAGNGITVVTGDVTMGAGSQVLADYGTAAEPGISFSGDPDTGLYRNQANGVGTAAGGANVFAYSTAVVNMNAISFSLPAGSYIDIAESTAPAAPAANTVRVYALDAAAKTRLASLFPTGVQQNITTEP